MGVCEVFATEHQKRVLRWRFSQICSGDWAFCSGGLNTERNLSLPHHLSAGWGLGTARGEWEVDNNDDLFTSKGRRAKRRRSEDFTLPFSFPLFKDSCRRVNVPIGLGAWTAIICNPYFIQRFQLSAFSWNVLVSHIITEGILVC